MVDIIEKLRAAGLTVSEPYQYMGSPLPYNRVVDITDKDGNKQTSNVHLLEQPGQEDFIVECVKAELAYKPPKIRWVGVPPYPVCVEHNECVVPECDGCAEAQREMASLVERLLARKNGPQ